MTTGGKSYIYVLVRQVYRKIKSCDITSCLPGPDVVRWGIAYDHLWGEEDMLDKIKKDSVQDLVFRQLKKAILAGEFLPGDKLPSEHELCAQMGVSRPSVKMAIQRLAVLGIVETRQGDGSYVSEFSPAALFDQVTEFLVDGDNIREVAEYRLHMELTSAQFAIQRADETDFAKMYEILNQMDRSLEDGDLEEHSRLDYLLHLTIVKASKNRFFIKMYEMMESINLQYVYLENKDFFNEYGKTEFEDVHRGLVDAIKAGDLERCRAIYTEKFSL